MEDKINLSEYVISLRQIEDTKSRMNQSPDMDAGNFVLTKGVKEFIKQIKEEIHNIFEKEEEWNMDDRIWFEGNIFKKIDEKAGEKFK